jgi:hypothetical protein
MFDDTRAGDQVDRMGVVVKDVEEWLEDNDYDVAEVTRASSFSWNDTGFSIGAENEALTIGYLADEGGEPVIHTYMLEEIWAMDEDEWRSEVDEMVEEW